MKKKLFSLFSACFWLIAPYAQAVYHDLPACYRDLEENFFIPEVVARSLSLHGVYQSQWGLIIQDLQRRTKEVRRIVDARASRMHPDPLNKPIDKEAAQALLLEVLFEIFEETLQERDYTSQSDIREMFNDIRHAQSARLQACFGTKKV